MVYDTLQSRRTETVTIPYRNLNGALFRRTKPKASSFCKKSLSSIHLFRMSTIEKIACVAILETFCLNSSSLSISFLKIESIELHFYEIN